MGLLRKIYRWATSKSPVRQHKLEEHSKQEAEVHALHDVLHRAVGERIKRNRVILEEHAKTGGRLMHDAKGEAYILPPLLVVDIKPGHAEQFYAMLDATGEQGTGNNLARYRLRFWLEQNYPQITGKLMQVDDNQLIMQPRLIEYVKDKET